MWRFLLVGYSLTLLLELPWYLWAFAERSWRERCLIAIFANAVSYPWVVLVFPQIFSNYDAYVGVAECFAPLSEILWVAWAAPPLRRRGALGIVLANLCSWLLGERLLA